MKVFSGFNDKTAEHLLLDAGAFFINFKYELGGSENDTYESAKTAGKLLGATKGGGEFKAAPTVRQIEVDGVKGRAKGMEVNDAWDVYIKATVLEVTDKTLQYGLGSSNVINTDSKYFKITGNNRIELTDYVENITWVGTISNSNEPVIIQVYNALNTDGLTLTVTDKNEATIPMTFYGHYDQSDLDTPPFALFYPKATS